MKNITEFLRPELEEVGKLLRETIDSESRLIREVGEFVALTQGKKLRPALTLLMHRALAGPGVAAPASVAAAVELIHVATLIHDDVIDKAKTRRGRPSVNAKWGDDVAILMADFLYARAFDLALSALKPAIMRIITQVTQRMCEGEMFQIEWRGRDLTPKDYFQVVERKTGQLFSAATALGALCAGRGEAEIELARAFGMDFGVAFQITDDMLDFTASDERWGKEIGMDASGCKQTLPILLALSEASDADRAFIEKWRTNGREAGPIREILARTNSIERSRNEARQIAERASGRLAALSPADPIAFEHLAALPGYVVNRLF